MAEPDGRNLAQRIIAERESLSQALGRIADYLIAEPQDFISRPMRSLAERIGVSEPTLIRFARHYGHNGMPDLRIALAMSLASADADGLARLEPRVKDKEVVNRAAKQAIADRAAALAESDRSVLLDSGSTLQYFARTLVTAPAKTIMATALNAAHILHEAEQHNIMMPGGTLRRGSLSLAGRLAETNLDGMTFDTAYLGADNIDPQTGLSTFGEEEAHLNRAMIRAARRVIVLADSTKFRGAALHHICNLSAIDTIVSDSALPDLTAQAIRAAGTTLILADLLPAPKNDKDSSHGINIH